MLALVLLAAGESRRLGTCKALAPLRPHPPLLHLFLAGRHVSDVPPIAVTGPHHAAIAEFLARTPAPGELRLVRNEHASAGRTGSVACAVRALPNADLILAPVDVPLVPRAVFDALALAWSAAGAPPRGWLAPRLEEVPAATLAPPASGDGRSGGSDSGNSGGRGSVGGVPVARGPRFGHPIVIGRALAHDLLELEPDRNLRSLRAQADPLLSIAVADPEILDDLDTPGDLAALQRR